MYTSGVLFDISETAMWLMVYGDLFDWLNYAFQLFMINGLLLFFGIPCIFIKLGRPVSRRKLSLILSVYAAIAAAFVIFVIYAVFFYNKEVISSLFNRGETNGIVIYLLLNIMPFIFLPISYCTFLKTNKVDVAVPRAYRNVRPVKAVVMEVDNVAAIEYNGSRYVFEKPLKFKLRDKVKVRLLKDKNECYLA